LLSSGYAGTLDPPPFPTRRSSDLRLRRQLTRAQARFQRVQHQRRAARILARRRSRDPSAWIRELYVGSELDRHQIDRVARLWTEDRKSTRLNSSHVKISYAVFCLK